MAKAVKRRKKDPGRKGRSGLRAKRGVREEVPEDLPEMESDSEDEGASEAADEEEQVVLQDGEDLEDNLTYHEDSLSVMKGHVATPLGEAVPVWITTDSGSMTQLIQADFARKLKLKTKPLPGRRCFCIRSPGGGQDMVDKYVRVRVRLRMKLHGLGQDGYEETEDPEEEREVMFTFGVCDSLPVPMLWGGAEMRRYGLMDHHDNKTLSMRLGDEGGPRYLTKSTSWLVAVAEMGGISDPRLKKVYKEFVPTPERLANMVKGERHTINMPAVLYPGRDNIVRIGRHNARVDEGHNEVVVLNRDAVAARYGDWLVVMDSVANGEAFIIVRNNSTSAINLAPGALEIAIRPAVCLPCISAVSSMHQPGTRLQTMASVADELKHHASSTDADQPLSHQLGAKLGKEASVADEFKLYASSPDADQPTNRRKFPGFSEDGQAERGFGKAVAMTTLSDYEDLSTSMKGERSPMTFLTWNCNGLALRMKNKDLEDRFYDAVMLQSPDIISLQEVRMPCASDDPGRVDPDTTDFVYWEEFMGPLAGEYTPYLTLSSEKYGGQAVLVKTSLATPRVSYNMVGQEGHHKDGRFMRLEFPDMVVRSVYAPFNGKGQTAHLERRRAWDEALFVEMAVLAEPGQGRVLMGDLNVVYRDTDISPHPDFWLRQGPQDGPIGDRGFGGTTRNERQRFQEMMECAELADTFTQPTGRRLEARWTFRGQGHFFGKGMKVDYVLTDDTILLSGGVKSSKIWCNGRDRDGFMGSDHAPLICELHPLWRTKRRNLLLHYEAAKKCTEAEAGRLFSTIEQRQQLAAMFTGVAARGGVAKAVTRTMANLATVGGDEPRPAEFPEEMWKYVHPDDKPMVGERYSRFKTREYLDDCIQQVMTQLDIQKREEHYPLSWKPVDDKGEWLQEDVLRAQALANLDCFFFPDPDEVAMAKDVVAEIETIDDKPHKCRSRKLSLVQQAFLQAKTNIMLGLKQLEDSKSDWCHGLVLVAYEDRINRFMEKHGEAAMGKLFEAEHEAEVATFFRLCIDLRMLNAKTIPDRFPLPRIDDLLENIPRGCGRFSISDIADAFFKCMLKKEDRHKTAFKTHNRHLQFAVLPQGFINSPSVFCRLIAKTFEGVDRACFSAYIDDVLNHTEEFEAHVRVQQDTYARLRKSQLTLKLSKTHLNYAAVKFLGHILTKEGRLPDPKAVEAICEWKDPTTAKEVRSFLGATLYYREYIYDYSDMAMPLYDLIRKGVVVDKAWDKEVHSKSIQRIKDALTSKPVLMQVDNTRKFRLKVDACRVGRGIGCILEQQNEHGKWQPVSYYSSSLSKEERNYSATELECKALHDCILHYAVYLKYIPHFEVFSDHNALRYMVNSDNATTNGRLMRYLLDLQEYNFSIYYRKGTENCDADAVSRLTRASDQPVYLTEDELSEENGIVTSNMLQRARALDQRNQKLEKDARKLLRRVARDNLHEMSILNDHILAEGVENLESETGRSRFFKNLQQGGLKCTREQLDDTLDEMLEDRGKSKDGEVEGAVDQGDPHMVQLAEIVSEVRGLEAMDAERMHQRPGECCSVHQVKRVNCRKADSSWILPVMLASLVDSVKATQVDADQLEEDRDTFGRMVRPRRELQFEELRGVRQQTRDRVRCLSSETTRDHCRALMTTRGASKKKFAKKLLNKAVAVVTDPDDASEDEDEEDVTQSPRTPTKKSKGRVRKGATIYGKAVGGISQRELRKQKREICYDLEVKTQPNWRREGQSQSERSRVNEALEACRRSGYGKVEVRKSLMEGDSGWGLFAVKSFKTGQEICSYEGVEVPEEVLRLGYGNRDYVASAIRDHQTQEVVYVDALAEESCYGRFCQDPIDDHLVNAKILWRQGKLKIIAAVDIDPADEVLIGYGLAYWESRLHLLHPNARARIEERTRRRRVEFVPEATVAEYSDSVALTNKLGLRIRSEGEVLRPTPDNFLTRAARYVPPEDVAEVGEVGAGGGLAPEALDALAFENVMECEALADELKFLNGRKFEDEGHLYEIWQVRYDPKSEHIIGFRRPLSGKTHKEDGCAFLVYGIEGLYELSERYLLAHPEERDTVGWPEDAQAWAMEQRRDEQLLALVDEITATGGTTVKVGRDKFSLVGSAGSATPLLVREVTDTRKGLIQQAMVPSVLVRLVLRYHHEGFGHMGANRMLETIRLRYFWHHMDKDIVKHTNKCINCKLRKSYQRRPKVPIMKYDDTARPLDRVHVDLTGPLPETKGKHKYIMVIKDYLTKYVWLVPLKTKSAVEVAEAFVGEFICQAGVPGRVVSDRGNEFVNRLLANVSRILCINRVSTTPYNPRSDGFVENHNKTLKDQLFHFVDTLKQDDWDVFLPTVQLMYNTTVSLATGYTPMLLMTGREAKMPSFNHMDSVNLEAQKSVLSNEYVLKMVETMRAYQDFALKQTFKNKERLNVRVRKPLEFVEYEPGQKFMKVRRPISTFKSADEEEAWKISMKLLERFEGPYTIIRKISPILYDADVDGKEERVHACGMKPF